MEFAKSEIRNRYDRHELLTIDEAAEYLRIHPGTLRNWIHCGRFSASDGLVRVGQHLLFVQATLKRRAEEGLLARPRRGATKHHQ